MGTTDNTHQRLNVCIDELQRYGIDLTATYEDWVKIGLSFASLGEEGRSYYHALASFTRNTTTPKPIPNLMNCYATGTDRLTSVRFSTSANKPLGPYQRLPTITEPTG